MLIILPAAAYCFLTLSCISREGSQLQEGVVKAHLVIFAYIAIVTELLSLVQAIFFLPILTAWICLVLSSLAYCIHKNKFIRLRRPLQLSFSEKFLVGSIALILSATFVTAVLYPPNNWDSMTYHMARVTHWMHNDSVAFYPTAIERQNYLAPLAEFAILHLQILAGSDRYANLAQWTSFVVVVCLGFLIASELGLSRKDRLLSAFIIATLPMGILQASSTQNDLVVSSFVLAFALFMLRLYKKLNASNTFFAAAALGLALLVKGTAYIYCAGIGTSLAIPLFLNARTNSIRLAALTAVSLILISAAALNAGHFVRNYKVDGNPLSEKSKELRNGEMAFSVLYSNIARNCTLHLGTLCGQVNKKIESAMRAVFGSQLNDPKTTWAGTSFSIIPYSRHEDLAGNLIQMLLGLLSLIVLPVLWCQGRCTGTAWYAIGIASGAVLYCWLLKWQPWASRLHTPLFALSAPLVAAVIAAPYPGGMACGRINQLLLLILLFYSLPFTFANASRSLVSLDWYYKKRQELLFANRLELFRSYKNVLKMFKKAKPQEVGLYLGSDDWEYPFWALAPQSITFKHVWIEPADSCLLPRYVIATKDTPTWIDEMQYKSIYTDSHVRLLKNSMTPCSRQ